MAEAATAAPGAAPGAATDSKSKSLSAELFAYFGSEVPNPILKDFQRARMQNRPLVMEFAHLTTKARRVVLKSNSALYVLFVNKSNLQIRRLQVQLA